jgi:transcriptional regulator of aromatic amino acid metabolism
MQYDNPKAKRIGVSTDELWRAYRELGSTKKVAARFGCGHPNVIQRLRRAGYTLTPRGQWKRS